MGTKALGTGPEPSQVSETKETEAEVEVEAGGTEGPDREEIFEVLSNQRRRHVLHYLEGHDGSAVELSELVDHVAAWENDTTVDRIDSSQRKRVYTALRQTHLPKLADCGIIEYDRRRGDLEITDNARQAQLYLEYVPGNDIPWCYHYLGLTAVLTGIVALAWLSVFPFAGLSGMTVAGIAVAAFGVSAVCHTLHTRRNSFDTGAEPRP